MLKVCPPGSTKTRILADLGVLQYKYTARTSKTQVRKTKELSLEESVGQLQTEDFQQIKKALHSGPTQRMIGNKSSGSKPGLEKAQQNTEEEEQETAQVDWGRLSKLQARKSKLAWCQWLLRSILVRSCFRKSKTWLQQIL